MITSPAAAGWPRRLAEILITAGAYLVGAHVGFLMQNPGTNTTPVWPPSGIGFAALLLCGSRVWPGVFLGALSANLTGFALSAGTLLLPNLAASFPIAVGNTLEGVAGLALVRRAVNPERLFQNRRGAFWFLAVTPAVCTIAATIGVTTLCLSRVVAWAEFDVLWFTWWLGDTTGVLVVTSLILVWARPLETHVGSDWKTEGALMIAALLLVCGLVFGVPFNTGLSRLPVTFLVLPPLVWAAYRFEHRGATLAIASASIFSVWAATGGSGPFARPDQNDSLLLVQGFVAMVAITTLVLASEVHARRRATEAIRSSQAALLQSGKLEAVGRLAGGIAHDFNNLLQVILGHASLLAANDRAAYEPIVEAANKGAGLVRQLLAYSRQQVLDPRNLDLNRLVEATATLLRPSIGEQIDLRIRTAPEPLTIHADRSNIERVLLNLVLNGRDAMPKGGTITIETGSLYVDGERAAPWGIPAGPYALVSVLDTGIGMDEQTLANVFDPFFTTKPSSSGTGLGLATTYGIVRQSGGHIEVRSKPGQGARFRVYLPRVSSVVVDTPAPVARVSRRRLGGKILLAEDNPAVREMIGNCLVAHGYEVISAADGQAAESLYHAESPHLVAVVTDVVMPRMTGTELARRIREHDPTTRVLFVSGHGEEVPMQSPGTSFLQKPFTPDALIARLTELLER